MSEAAVPTIEPMHGLDRALDSLAGGTHGDPFALLGPHARRGGRGAIVRAFHPAASRVEVVQASGVTAMVRTHNAGIYEAVLDDARLPFTYELRVTYPDGTVHTAQEIGRASCRERV